MVLVRLVLPPLLVVILAIQLASAVAQKDDHSIIARVEVATEEETITVRELYEFQYKKSLASAHIQAAKLQANQHEIDFSAVFNSSTKLQEELWTELREEKERLYKKLVDTIKAIEVWLIFF